MLWRMSPLFLLRLLHPRRSAGLLGALVICLRSSPEEVQVVGTAPRDGGRQVRGPWRCGKHRCPRRWTGVSTRRLRGLGERERPSREVTNSFHSGTTTRGGKGQGNGPTAPQDVSSFSLTRKIETIASSIYFGGKTLSLVER